MIDITTNIREAVEKIKRVPRQLEQGTIPVLQDAAEKIRRIMARAGLAVRYPINWDSPKQKRAFFATNGFGGGIPYQRTNEHINAFTVNNLPNGAELSNVGHKAVFLYGTVSGTLASAKHVLPTGQSHIHEGRHRLIRPVIDAVLSRLPKDIRDNIRIFAND